MPIDDEENNHDQSEAVQPTTDNSVTSTTGQVRFVAMFALTLIPVCGIAWLTIRLLLNAFLYQGTGMMAPLSGAGPLKFVPLADVVGAFVVGVVACCLVMLLRIFLKNRFPMSVGIFVVLFVVFLSFALMLTMIHDFAKVALAGGLAISVTRFIANRPATVARLVKGMKWIAILLVIAASLIVYLIERRPPPSVETPESKPANVLLIVLDTVRSESLSLYGHQRPTSPNLDEFAKSGVVFDQAIATAPWTLPTHASLFTGKYPHELSCGFISPLSDEPVLLAEVLRERGYVSVGFAANQTYCGARTGLDRGMNVYDVESDWPALFDERTVLGRAMVPSYPGRGTLLNILAPIDRWTRKQRKPASQVNREFLDWEASRGDRPFFAFLNYFDAHDPLEPPDEYLQKFERENSPNKDLNKYEACIAWIDDNLGELFTEMNRRGLSENTLVVIVGDHGDHFGEHGLTGHGNSVYTQLTRVPMIFVWPQHVPEGKRISRIATLRDVPATVLELLAIKDDRIDGESFVKSWNSPRSNSPLTSSPVLSELHTAIRNPDWPNGNAPIGSIFVDSWHYIRNLEDGREEIYDIEADPTETADLIDTDQGREILEELRSAYDASIPANFAETMTEKKTESE